MDKIRENRLRRMAERQGLQLSKSRRRDPRATDFGKFFLSQNGILMSPESGMDLDEIEAYLGGGPEVAVIPSDDPNADPSRYELPHLQHGPEGWRLWYRDTAGEVDEHLLAGRKDDVDGARQSAREYLLRYGHGVTTKD